LRIGPDRPVSVLIARLVSLVVTRERERERTSMQGASDLQRALGECLAAEFSGVTYDESVGERFPGHGQEFNVLALVERTTKDLIEAVARRCEVSIDHGRTDWC
jgi:hypothetical protein